MYAVNIKDLDNDKVSLGECKLDKSGYEVADINYNYGSTSKPDFRPLIISTPHNIGTGKTCSPIQKESRSIRHDSKIFEQFLKNKFDSFPEDSNESRYIKRYLSDKYLIKSEVKDIGYDQFIKDQLDLCMKQF